MNIETIYFDKLLFLIRSFFVLLLLSAPSPFPPPSLLPPLSPHPLFPLLLGHQHSMLSRFFQLSKIKNHDVLQKK